MESIDILEQEHDVILRALDVLSRVVDTLEGGHNVRAEAMVELVTFFQRFADAAHHAKEEQVLFPALGDAGMPRDQGPIGVMLHEHTQGRALVAAMASAAGAAPSSAAERNRYCQAAREFEGLLRDHIDKENEVLFPMARNFLAPDLDEELLGAYRIHVEQVVSPDEYARQLQHLEGLEREFPR